MISDWRRQQIVSYMESPEKAATYLNLIENKIIDIHRKFKGGLQLARELSAARGMLTSYLEILAEHVTTLGFEHYPNLKKRASDYLRQMETPPEDFHRVQEVDKGANLILDVEEEKVVRVDLDNAIIVARPEEVVEDKSKIIITDK